MGSMGRRVVYHFEQTTPTSSFSDARERVEAQPKAEVTFPAAIKNIKEREKWHRLSGFD